MKAYKYTLIKYLKSPSTWVILGFGIILSFILGGWLPFTYGFNPDRQNAAVRYAILVIIIASMLTSFLSLFVSVFAGFKAAQMFRDEVEDGTFLVMLSKPITRRSLLLFKWLALQTMMVLFNAIVISFFALSVLLFDKGDELAILTAIGFSTLKSNITSVAFFMFLILMTTSTIFTSLAILISTKMGSGATIGITSALGIIIPITGVVSTFTRNIEYTHIENDSMTNTYNFISRLDQQTSDSSNNNVQLVDLEPLIDSFKDLYEQVKSDDGLLGLGISTGETDGFKSSWFADINYHFQLFSTFASDQVIPDELKGTVESISARHPESQGIFVPTKSELTNTENLDITNSFRETIALVNPLRDQVFNLCKTIFGDQITQFERLVNVTSGESLFNGMDISYKTIRQFETWFGYNLKDAIASGEVTVIDDSIPKISQTMHFNTFSSVWGLMNSFYEFIKHPATTETTIYWSDQHFVPMNQMTLQSTLMTYSLAEIQLLYQMYLQKVILTLLEQHQVNQEQLKV